MNYALIVVKLTSVRWKVVVDIQGIDLTNSIFIKLDWITLKFTRHYTVEPLTRDFSFVSIILPPVEELSLSWRLNHTQLD